jgi:hypothetical protein
LLPLVLQPGRLVTVVLNDAGADVSLRIMAKLGFQSLSLEALRFGPLTR